MVRCQFVATSFQQGRNASPTKVRLVQECKTLCQQKVRLCQDKRMRCQEETRASQKKRRASQEKLRRSRNSKRAFAFAEPHSQNNRRRSNKAQTFHKPKHDTNPTTTRNRRMTMNTTTKSIRRLTVALALPRSVPALISYAQGVVTGMRGNPSFPNPSPALAAVIAAIDQL